MSVILNPVEQYFDLDGEPLQSGYIYFGEVCGNPVTQPTMVYFDPEFTIPAAQPVRTVNGFPVRSGTATGLYAPDDVSILVQNSKREQVIYIQSSAINAGDTTTFYRTSNAALTADDNNRTFIALSAFTQTFDPAVNLGDRWRVNIVNMSGGNLILDPNLAETIDGQASLTLTANQSITVYCNGVNLFTNLVSIKLVPDDPYSESGWNGNTSVPTKNAVRDKIEGIISNLPQLETAASDPSFTSVSAVKAATPQWIKSGWAISFGTTGYIKLPNCLGGLIVQWGSGTGTISFPLAFPNAALNIIVQLNVNTFVAAGLDQTCVTSLTPTSFTRANSGNICRYFAVGY